MNCGCDQMGFNPTPGGAGVTPFTENRCVDAASVAISPKGGYSLSDAFPTITAAMANIPSGGVLQIQIGSYNEDVIGADSIAYRFIGAGGLTGQHAQIVGSVSIDTLSAEWLQFNSTVGTGGSSNQSSFFRNCAFLTGIHASKGVNIEYCSFAGGDTTIFSQPSYLLDCTFALLAAQIQGNCTALDCTFDGVTISNGVTGNSFTNCTFTSVHGIACGTGGGGKFFGCNIAIPPTGASIVDTVFLYNCTFTDATRNLGDCHIDGASEKQALNLGLGIAGELRAIDLGQGGTAHGLTGTASIDFSAVSRFILPKTVAANAVITIATTGGTNNQLMFVDVYPSGHTVNFKFGAADLVPATTVTVPTRFTFGVTSDGTAIQYLYNQAL